MDERKYRREHGRKAFVEVLRYQSAKYFGRKGESVRQSSPYVLARHADWPSNIILERVAQYIEKEIRERKQQKKHFALHTYVHHGLSSQALLWNLLGPLVADKRWDLLTKVLKEAGISLQGQVSNAEFEVEDPEVLGERGGQPTSVDMRLSTTANEQVFLESKFTEADFGGCSVFRDGDCDGRNPANDFNLCYLHRIDRKYWLLMKKHGLLEGSIKKDAQCSFINLYQAYRLVLFALEQDGHFLLLYDERNPAFVTVDQQGLHRGLFDRVLKSLPEHAQRRCHSISMQRVVSILELEQLEWLQELKEKYF